MAKAYKCDLCGEMFEAGLNKFGYKEFEIGLTITRKKPTQEPKEDNVDNSFWSLFPVPSFHQEEEPDICPNCQRTILAKILQEILAGKRWDALLEKAQKGE